MKILCLILLLAFVGYSTATVKTCQQCTSAVNCANLSFEKTKETCKSSGSTINNVGCYRKSKSGVLLMAGCATKANCDAAGKVGECKTDSKTEIQTCCCAKDNCNGAGFLKMSFVLLAALVSVPLLL